MKNQQKIHKIDMSGKSVSPEAQVDILLSDLLEQAEAIADAKDEQEKNVRISNLHSYVRGHRDGLRLMREDPFKSIAH